MTPPEHIFHTSPFGTLAEPSRGELYRLFRHERLPRGFELSREGAPAQRLVLIGSGRVRVERHGRTSGVQLGHRGPRQTVGEGALVGGRAAVDSARVLDAVEALVAPVREARALVEARADVRAALVELALAVRREAEERLAVLLACDVRARLADVLLGAVARWGVPHADGELIAAPFTHADLAALVGSTRETTTLVLARLRGEGLIGFERRRIVVRSRAALAACVAAA